MEKAGHDGRSLFTKTCNKTPQNVTFRGVRVLNLLNQDFVIDLIAEY
jgi:hypothetical protein